MQTHEEPVEVRRGDGAPEQFLWRGGLWQVRRVLAHRVDTEERWRVEAGKGLVGGTGVFDLALDRADGRWQLVGCHD